MNDLFETKITDNDNINPLNDLYDLDEEGTPLEND